MRKPRAVRRKPGDVLAETTVLARRDIYQPCLRHLSMAESTFLQYLILVANDKRGDDRRSLSRLAEELGCTKSYAGKILDDLAHKKLIRRDDAGSRKVTMLLVPPTDLEGSNRFDGGVKPNGRGVKSIGPGVKPVWQGVKPRTRNGVLNGDSEREKRTGLAERVPSSESIERTNSSSPRRTRSRTKPTPGSSLRSQQTPPPAPSPDNGAVKTLNGMTAEDLLKLYGQQALLIAPSMFEDLLDTNGRIPT